MAQHPDDNCHRRSFQMANIVDRIGALKAEIAPLEKQLKKLQDELKARGVGRYEGDLYDATVFTSIRSQLDMDAVRAKLSPQFLTAHTSEVEAVTVKVSAKQLSIAA
jgi:hypothetical protein